MSQFSIQIRFFFGLVSAVGCGPSNPNLICGPGTHRDGHVCVPTEEAVDSAISIDTGDPEPIDTGEDTGGETIEDPEEAPIQVYLLAGQSNMEGIGQISALPPSLRVAQEDINIFWSGAPVWRGLQPSSGYSSGWGEVFGPEVMFGRTLADANPDGTVALIKHSVGGTDLAAFWNPGVSGDDPTGMGEGYAVWIETVRTALAVLDARDQTYEIAGMIWMQGESDACYDVYADSYQRNMAHFIDRAREDVATPEMPFVIGLIDCLGLCAYRTTVREAQIAVAEGDEAVHVIETEDLGMYPTDGWHYQGLGMRVLGTRFAEALLGAEQSALPQAAITLTGTYSYGYTGNYTVGWSFDVHERIRITDLGIFDFGDDGLTDSGSLGIWEAQSGSLLLSAYFPNANQMSKSYVGGFRTIGVEPHILDPGSYIIGNTTVSGDPNYYVYQAGYGAAESVTWTAGMHVDGAVLDMPVYTTAGTDTVGLWFGPNFLYYAEP